MKLKQRKGHAQVDRYAKDRQMIDDAIVSGGRRELRNGVIVCYHAKFKILTVRFKGKGRSETRVGTVIRQLGQLNYRTGKVKNNLTFSVIPIAGRTSNDND